VSGDTHRVELTAAEQLARRLMAEYGLTGRGWSFRFNNRKRALGLCRYETRQIELSTLFVALNDEAAVQDTLLHEIAHAQAGVGAGHGRAWIDACHRLGARPDRLCTTAVMPPGTFRAQCKGCGREHDRHRRPMRGRSYYCLSCGPRRGKLRFVRQSSTCNKGRSPLASLASSSARGG
jgi:predicted SprT family Zn-dependent metalloprotease